RLEELNRFLQRALAKDKKDRQRDAAEFFKEFEIALFGATRPAARPKQKVDAKDEVFASVFAASIELPAILLSANHSDFGDTVVETMPGEYRLEPTMGGGGPGMRRRQRLKSAWMMSVGMQVGPEISGVGD